MSARRDTIPPGWYNAAHQRKPPRSQHYIVKAQRHYGDEAFFHKYNAETLADAKYLADHWQYAAYVVDQWAKPTPGIIYVTSPALRGEVPGPVSLRFDDIFGGRR